MHALFALGAPEYVLRRAQFIPRPRHEVFAFFEDPLNLPRITPPWLDFKIRSVSTATIQPGSRIDYTLRWLGVRVRWRTLIETWERDRSFVDTQLRGPYILWHHTHTFDDAPGGTQMQDAVRYRLPFGPAGMLAHALLVKRQLNTIFDFRRDQVEEIFT